MKITGSVSRTTLALILTCICLAAVFAQTTTAEKASRINPLVQKVLKVSDQTEPELPARADAAARPRTSFVKTADFYLRDGRLVYGKLITEDKNKVMVEELDGSTIVLNIYSRRDIDPRTLQTKNVPESRFYADLAQYFEGRTWDFKDDPDDFVQAIRCYEKAKMLITGNSRLDSERTAEIVGKIEHLQADRLVWEREVASRAKLRELELAAEFDSKFSDLKDQMASGNQKIEDSIKRLNTVITEMQENRQNTEQNLPVIEQDIRRQLSILANQVEANRRLIDPYYRNAGSRIRYGPYDRFGY